MMKNITVLILGGGDSTRFWPLHEKLFINFFGKPLLYYRLTQLQKNGLSNNIIICNKDNEHIFIQFRDQFPHLPFTLIQQTDKRGMAGAVLSAEKYLKSQEVIIVKPVDLFEDMLFDRFKSKLSAHPQVLLTGFTTDTYFPGGYLKITDDEVTQIVEKPKEGDQPSNIVRLVFDYFKDITIFMKSLKTVSSTKDDLYEVALSQLIKQGIKCKVLEYDGYWGYLQYPWHVLSVMSHFLSKINSKKIKKATIASSAVIKGDVYLEDGVQILENAKIIGPAYIGKNTLIGNNTLIRESMIGENCVIGFGSEITRSYIGNNSWFHTNYLGDSIIADRVGMGAGVVCANFRLDEESISSMVGSHKIDTNKNKLGAIIGADARLGINVSIMPGIKVGTGSFVGSAVVLDKDLPDYSSCFMRGNYTIKPNRSHLPPGNREKLKNNLKI